MKIIESKTTSHWNETNQGFDPTNTQPVCPVCDNPMDFDHSERRIVKGGKRWYDVWTCICGTNLDFYIRRDDWERSDI